MVSLLTQLTTSPLFPLPAGSYRGSLRKLRSALNVNGAPYLLLWVDVTNGPTRSGRFTHCEYLSHRKFSCQDGSDFFPSISMLADLADALGCAADWDRASCDFAGQCEFRHPPMTDQDVAVAFFDMAATFFSELVGVDFSFDRRNRVASDGRLFVNTRFTPSFASPRPSRPAAQLTQATDWLGRTGSHVAIEPGAGVSDIPF